MELGSVGSDAEDGFAEAVDAVGGSFEGLGGGIFRWASDDHLNRMVGEEGGSQAVGGGEEREDAENLIVERAFEGGAADAVAEAASFAPDFFQDAVECFQGEGAGSCAM